MSHKNVVWTEIDFDTPDLNRLCLPSTPLLDCDSEWSLGYLFVIMFQLFLDFALSLHILAD